jgi:hypothetical protein
MTEIDNLLNYVKEISLAPQPDVFLGCEFNTDTQERELINKKEEKLPM